MKSTFRIKHTFNEIKPTAHKCVFECLDLEKSLFFFILTVTWVLILEDYKHATRLLQIVMDAGNQKTPFFRMLETIHVHVKLVLNYFMSKTTSTKDSFLFYCSPAITLT